MSAGKSSVAGGERLPVHLAVLACIVACVVAASPAVYGQACEASCEWGYGPDDGPPRWAELCCPVCDGRSQSPIDIRTDEVVPGDLGPLAVNYGESHFEFANNGHTLQASYELLDQDNHIEFGGVKYPLNQFHFHSLGEHTIDGEAAPMEMHFVHRRTSYDIVVVAVRVVEGQNKPAFNGLWNSLPSSPTVEPRTVVINAKRMLPNRLSYYTYRGSLTTPDCSEVVTWVVLQEPMNMSSEQIEAFRAIFPGNYRPTQPLNGRSVRSGS